MSRSARAAAMVLIALLTADGSPAAPRPKTEQAKIDALLQEMQASDAVFIRNGKEYSGKKAASHLRRKLAFAGDRVRTARDFVAGIATRSEETGEPYRLRPRGGQLRPLGDWLGERLVAMERKP